jgi:hypothetical protein
MVSKDGITRREFVASASGAAVGALVAGQTGVVTAQAKRSYAFVGSGVRCVGMWGRPIVRDYADWSSSSVCATSIPRAEEAKRQLGVSCPPSPASTRWPPRPNPTC